MYRRLVWFFRISVFAGARSSVTLDVCFFKIRPCAVTYPGSVPSKERDKTALLGHNRMTFLLEITGNEVAKVHPSTTWAEAPCFVVLDGPGVKTCATVDASVSYTHLTLPTILLV